jgi:hypothetical protein
MQKVYFNTYIAQMYGIKKAVLLHWLRTQLKEHPEAYVYTTVNYLACRFPFLSKRTLYNILYELEHTDGLIISDQPKGCAKSYSLIKPMLVPDTLHTFQSDHAVSYGIEKAILISNIYFWLQLNEKKNRNAINKKIWMYASASTLAQTFPYITRATISRHLRELETNKIILSGQFNKLPFDKTKWYTFTDTFKESERERLKEKRRGGLPILSKGVPILSNQYQIDNTDSKNNILLTQYASHTSLEKCCNRPSGAGENPFLFKRITEEKKEEDIVIYFDKYRDTDKKKEDTNILFNINNNIRTDKYIKLWNMLEIRNHKTGNKTYKRINIYIDKILTGNFTEKLSKDWLISLNIKNLFKQPLTEEQIISAMVQYSLKFEKEYAPEDKSKLNRSLADFIYNRMTQTSQLLLMLQKPPRKVNDIDPRTVRNHLPSDVANKIDKLLQYKNIQSDKKKRLIYIQVNQTLKAMDELVIRHKEVYNTNVAFKTYIARKSELIDSWLEFVSHKQVIDNYTFAVYGSVWADFITYLENLHNISLSLSEEEVKKIIRKRRKVKEETAIDKEDVFNVYEL